MKRTVSVVLSAVLCFGAVVSVSACENGGSQVVLLDRGNWTVTSPDGTLSAEMTLDGRGQMYYTVDKGDVRVVERSELGMDIDLDDFDVVTVDGVNTRRVTGSYTNKSGRNSEVSYDCNETTVTLKGWEFYLDITMRAYDDGYAFRYGIRAIDGSSGVMTVYDEESQFALPEDTSLWAQEYVSNLPTEGDFFSYEVAYNRRQAENLTTEYLAMPLLYRVDGTDVYSMIAESGLIGSGYYGSFLKVPQGQEGSGILKTEHTPAGIKVDDNQVEYPFESPWRIGITGDLKTVNESELVEKVYDDAEYWKPDNYDELSEDEQKIYDYDWVEPGVTVWSWIAYQGNQNDYNMHRQYVDLASEMGWKYILLDGGWNAGLDVDQFKSFTAYANRQGVKVIIWCDAMTSFANGREDVLRARLAEWKSWGISGIKIDFFDGQSTRGQKHQGEDIDTIKWYEKIYQVTAEMQLVVNCHGSNKPTGERRVYPHILNREAVYGNENRNVGASYTVNQMFIRNVVGPTDFTPVVEPLSNGLTPAHQLALSLLYEAGLPSFGDFAETYYRNDINELFKALPVLRDETLFIDGRLDYYYVSAIRSGGDWFVGGINSVVASTVTLNFDFLGDGDYTVQLFTDDIESASLQVDEFTVKKGDVRTVEMAARGGFVMWLTPAAE